MREELIGYLLGALDAEEQARVEQALETSAELRQELELLALSLEPLEAEAEGYDPPAGLATRTCQFVAQHAAIAPVTKPAGASRDRLITTGRWSLTDMLVSVGVCAAAVLLFLPAIAQSRHQASLAYCQNNLRTLSTALTSYSDVNGGFFPAIPAEGKAAAAGYFGTALHDQGFLTDGSKLLCTRKPSGSQGELDRSIPSLAEVTAAEGRELADLIKRMGGDYAYVLGYVDDGKLFAVRNHSRPTFAILSDAPNLGGASRTSLNHGGCGQNVLFEDGHVQFVVGCQLGCGDNLFLNDAGFPEAGTHPDDAVLGPSSMPPVHLVRVKLDR